MTRSLRQIFKFPAFTPEPVNSNRLRPQVTRDEIAALFGPELGYAARDFAV